MQRFHTQSVCVFLCKFLVVSVLGEGIHLQNHMIQEVEEKQKTEWFHYISQTSTGCAKAADNLAIHKARLG